MSNILYTILVIILILGMLNYFNGGMEKDLAKEAISQYDIAKRNNCQGDAYIQAGLIAQFYLQAKDEENYRKWKEVEEKEKILFFNNSN